MVRPAPRGWQCRQGQEIVGERGQRPAVHVAPSAATAVHVGRQVAAAGAAAAAARRHPVAAHQTAPATATVGINVMKNSTRLLIAFLDHF